MSVDGGWRGDGGGGWDEMGWVMGVDVSVGVSGLWACQVRVLVRAVRGSTFEKGERQRRTRPGWLARVADGDWGVMGKGNLVILIFCDAN